MPREPHPSESDNTTESDTKLMKYAVKDKTDSKAKTPGWKSTFSFTLDLADREYVIGNLQYSQLHTRMSHVYDGLTGPHGSSCRPKRS